MQIGKTWKPRYATPQLLPKVESEKLRSTLLARGLVSTTLLAALLGCGDQGRVEPFLMLEELGAVVLPDSMTVLALMPVTGRGLFVVSQERPVLRLGPADSIVELPVRVGRQFMALRRGNCNRCVVLLARAGDDLVEVDAHSSRITNGWRWPRHKWLSAAWDGARWVALASGFKDTTYLVSLEKHSGVRVLSSQVHARPPFVASDSSWTPAVRVTASGDRLLVASIEAPYRTYVILHDGRALLSLTPPQDKSAVTSRPTGASIVTLATYWLNAGYLQVLGDLRSDYRELHLFDSTGRWIRSRHMEAPWGPAYLDIAQSQLLVVRGTGPHEAVYYRWKWVEATF